MKTLVKTVTLTIAALVGATSLALAQAPPPAPTPTTPPAATAPAKPTPPATAKKGTPQKRATTPEGVVCSAEADKNGLKGRERRNYRARCKAAVKKGQPPPPVTPVKAAPKAAPKT